MTRYWVISPYDSTVPETWERVWRYDLAHGIISVGWNEMGDISNYSESELKAAIERTYGDQMNLGKKTQSFTILWNFYHNVQNGDVVIARKGTKKIAAIGTILRAGYYDRAKAVEASGPEIYYYPNHLDVRWNDTPRDKEFDRIVFGRQTMYEISESRFRELVGEPQLEAVELAEEGVQDRTEFVLEKYLEDFIVSNFSAIFRGELILYQDPEEGASGQQYATDVGTIDILAQESSTGNLVVVELKKGRESDKVVGQLLRYMGWVFDNLCRDGQIVKGIIICKDADPRLSYALRMTNNIMIKYYQIDFKLSDTPFSG